MQKLFTYNKNGKLTSHCAFWS